MNRTVQGIGVNDAEYPVNPRVKDGRSTCPYYAVWSGMLKRCYSEKYKLKRPTYSGCYVYEKWLTFSNFKAWMELQDWRGKELDKDILVKGNKVYSPETCCFVTKTVNSFVTDSAARRGDLPIGVTEFHGKYRSECCDPFKKSVRFLGQFNTPIQAHEAWRKRKHELACQLADLQTDQRVAEALRTRYL